MKSINQLLASQEEAFLEQVKEAQGILHKVCNMYCDSPTDRQDLLQEMLIQLWKAYPSFRGDAQFSTWLYRVVLNVALQYLARQKREQSRYEANTYFASTLEASASEQDKERALRLQKAISQLSAIERAIVLLYLDHKGSDEIAAVMGITPNNVRVKMNRIRKKLKKII